MRIKQKIYLFIGISLIIIINLVFLAIKPIITKIKLKSKEIREQKILYQTLKQEEINLRQLKKDYQDLEPKIPLLGQTLLDPEKTIDFIKFLEETAKKTSSQQNITIMPPGEKSLGFRINLEGSFPNLIRFLAWLENGPYLVVVDSIGSTKQEKEIKTTLEMRVYTNEINQTSE